jgi:UDP-N-acetylenolpyruvoylglucosamine reductase
MQEAFQKPGYQRENAKVFLKDGQPHHITSGGWQRETACRMAYRSMPAKRHSVGGAAVHQQQALVLINQRCNQRRCGTAGSLCSSACGRKI